MESLKSWDPGQGKVGEKGFLWAVQQPRCQQRCCCSLTKAWQRSKAKHLSHLRLLWSRIQLLRKQHRAAGSNFQLWSSLGCHHSGSIHTNTSYSSLLVPLLHICTCGVHLLWDAWWSLKFFFAEFSQRWSPNLDAGRSGHSGWNSIRLVFDHPGTSRYLPHSKSVLFAQGTTKRKRWRAFRSMARPALVRINVRAPSLTKPKLGNVTGELQKSILEIFIKSFSCPCGFWHATNHHTSIQHVQILRNSTINSSNPSCLRAEDHSGSTWSSTLELNRLDGTTGKECQKLTWNSSIFYFYTFLFIRFSMLGSFFEWLIMTLQIFQEMCKK